MDLPDLETGFSDTILGITWHGSAKLRHGQFWGLSTISRTGDTSFTVEGDKLRLTAYVGIRGASAHYDASLSSWESQSVLVLLRIFPIFRSSWMLRWLLPGEVDCNSRISRSATLAT